MRGAAGMEPTARAREIATLVTAAIEQIDAALRPRRRVRPGDDAGDIHRRHGGIRRNRAGRGTRPGVRSRRQARRCGYCRRPAAASPNSSSAVRSTSRSRMSPNLPAHIDATVLLRDPFVVAARQGHPVAARPMSLEAYAAQNHVLVSPRGDTTGALDRILVDFGLKRRIALLVATYLAVPAALAASDLDRNSAAPCRRADRRERRDRDHAIADRLRDDRVDGLAPPRRRRPRPILVPRPADRRGEYTRHTKWFGYARVVSSTGGPGGGDRRGRVPRPTHPRCWRRIILSALSRRKPGPIVPSETAFAIISIAQDSDQSNAGCPSQ